MLSVKYSCKVRSTVMCGYVGTYIFVFCVCAVPVQSIQAL